MIRKINPESYLIIICGLPGTGKSTIAAKLIEGLTDYVLVDQNAIRRKLGYKIMPQRFDLALRTIDRQLAKVLQGGQGAIFDSVNRYTFRRQQIYGVASCCGMRVVTLEVVCPEEVAKSRMSKRKRPKGDKLVSDPKYPRVYDKLKKEWEPVEMDFLHFGSDHVNHVIYDSHLNKMTRVIEQRGSRGFISKIEKILTKE